MTKRRHFLRNGLWVGAAIAFPGIIRGALPSQRRIVPVAPASAAVSPSDFPNLVGWWKADSFTGLSDGDPVGEAGVTPWVDSSGSGRDATQGTLANRPLYKTNIFGSMPAIRFDGTNDFLAFNNWQVITTFADFSIFFLCDITATAAVLFHSNNNQIIRQDNTIQFFTSGSPISRTSSTFGTTFGDICLASMRLHTVTTNRTIEFWENTTSRGTGGNVLDTLDLRDIGGISFNRIAGDVAEICIYDGFIADADVTTLYDGYFKPRWGLP